MIPLERERERERERESTCDAHKEEKPLRTEPVERMGGWGILGVDELVPVV